MGKPKSGDHRMCTECGWNTPSFRAICLPWWHYRRYAPLVLGVAILAWFAVTPSTNSFSSGEWSPRYVMPGFSRAQVQRIANGEADGAGFAASMHKQIAQEGWDGGFGGPVRVSVSFAEGEGSRSVAWWFGWPTWWVSESRTSYYEDAVLRTGRRQATINPNRRKENPFGSSSVPELSPRDEWSWVQSMVVHRPPPEKAGGDDVSCIYHLTSPLAMLGVVLLSVWSLWKAIGVVSGWTGRSLSRRVRASVAWLAPLAVFGLILARSGGTHEVVLANSPPRQIALAVPALEFPEFRRIASGGDEIENLASMPGGDRALAREILDATGPGDDSESLRVWIASTALIQTGVSRQYPGWMPTVYFESFGFFQRPEEGPVIPVRPAWERRWSGFGSSMSYAWIRPDDTVQKLSVHKSGLGLLLLGLIAIASVDLWLFGPFWRWRGRLAQKRGLCPECRQPLMNTGSVAATTNASS
ncbi:MAG: hypothetical protein HEQ23_10795 [Tepidisphaera sp.]